MTDTTVSDTTAVAPKKSALYAAAIVLSSLVIALPIFVGRVVEAVLDTANPADVDTSADLAYLREILVSSFVVVGLLIVVIIVVLAILYRRAKTLDAIKLPLLILTLQIGIGVITLLLTGLTNT